MSRRWYLLSSHCKHFLPNSRPAATGRPLCKRPGAAPVPAVAGRCPRCGVQPSCPSCPTDTLSARGHAACVTTALNPCGPAAAPAPGWAHTDLPPPGAGILGCFGVIPPAESTYLPP